MTTNIFVNRTEEKQIFSTFLANPKEHGLIFSGLSGSGKTTLIHWLEDNHCRPRKISTQMLSADTWLSYQNVLDQLLIGLSDKAPDAYGEYQNFKLKAKERTNFPASINIRQFQIMGQSNVQQVHLGLEKVLEKVEQTTRNDLTEYWLKCFENVDLDQLVIFVDGFDSYNRRSHKNEIEWFWSTIYQAKQKLAGLKIVLSTTTGLKYIPDGVKLHRIEGLAHEHAVEMMMRLGVDSEDYCNVINYNIAHGHPIILELATIVWEQSEGELSLDTIPAITKHDKSIEWMKQKVLASVKEAIKNVLPRLSLLRYFDYDIIREVIDDKFTTEQFAELLNFPFVKKLSQHGKWIIHPAVRSILSSEFKEMFPKLCIEFHDTAQDYFERRDDAIESMYHRFFVNTDIVFQTWLEKIIRDLAKFDLEEYEPLLVLISENDIQLILSDDQLCDVAFCYGRSLQNLDSPYSASKVFDETYSKYIELTNYKGAANCLMRWLEIEQQHNFGQLSKDDISRCLHDIQDLLQKADDKLGLANLGLYWSQFAYEWNDLDASKALIQGSSELFETMNDPYKSIGLANSNVLLAIISSEFDVWNQRFSKALELFASVQIQLGKANTLLEFSKKLISTQRYQEAYVNANLALEIFDSTKHVYGQIRSASLIYNVEKKLDNIISQVYWRNRMFDLLSVFECDTPEIVKLKEHFPLNNSQVNKEFFDNAINTISHTYGERLKAFVVAFEREDECNTAAQLAMNMGFLVLLGDTRHRISSETLFQMMLHYPGSQDDENIPFITMDVNLEEINDDIVLIGIPKHKEFVKGLAILVTEWKSKTPISIDFSKQINVFKIDRTYGLATKTSE